MMDTGKFAYCFSEKDKQELEKQNMVLVRESTFANKKCWIFLNTNKINFSKVDKNAILFTDRMDF